MHQSPMQLYASITYTKGERQGGAM